MARVEPITVRLVLEHDLTSSEVLAIIEDHEPDPLTDWSEKTWLECSCGWLSLERGLMYWHQHLVDAVDEVRLQCRKVWSQMGCTSVCRLPMGHEEPHGWNECEPGGYDAEERDPSAPWNMAGYS